MGANTMSHSTNTQINVNHTPKMPNFMNCHIGTINFNVYKN